MKKNKLMRLASVLLVLTLLTTCVIGGTYAKYITSDSANDVARVAKFGVVASVSGDLFADSYQDSTANTAQSWGKNKPTVSASTQGTAIVAPGTQGDKNMIFSVKGTPEVSTAVSFGRSLKADGSDAKQYAAVIELVNGKYGVMVPYTGDVTTDTVGNYYKMVGGVFSHAVAADLSSNPATPLYELHDYAEVAATASGVTGHDYLPIVWRWAASPSGTLPATLSETRDLKAVFTGITSNFSQSFDPNKDNALVAALNWRWNFEDDDYSTTASDGTRTPSGSVYSSVDRRDTILGDMIALSGDALNSDCYVVKLGSSSTYTVDGTNTTDSWDQVKTTSLRVVGSEPDTNSVTVAYTGTLPTTAVYNADILAETPGTINSGICAVLGVAFDASLTVTQVD